MNADKIKPLYRKINSTTYNCTGYYYTGDAKYDKNTKKGVKKSMGKNINHGLDYTPLYKFLLSSVGENFEYVYREAMIRLKPLPFNERERFIFYMIAKNEDQIGSGFFRVGESTYFSKLIVDEDGILQIADKSVTNETLFPSCGCCTHTFNGKLFINKYVK